MAKQCVATSFTNAVLTEVDGVFYIEEFKVTKDKVESKGKWNLTDRLMGIVNTEYISLGFDIKSELDSEE